MAAALKHNQARSGNQQVEFLTRREGNEFILRSPEDQSRFFNVAEHRFGQHLGKALGCFTAIHPAPVGIRPEEFADPRIRAHWKRERGMQVFSFHHPHRPMELVDVFIDEPIEFAAVEREKRVFTAQGVAVPVISIRHLKQLKALSGRPQDLADIEALESLERAEPET